MAVLQTACAEFESLADYMKLPTEVKDALEEKISWLLTYLHMSKEYGFDAVPVKEAKQKLKVIRKFLSKRVKRKK